MIPEHIKSLIHEAQSAVHYLHTVDGRLEGLQKESYWRAGDLLQQRIDAALIAEGITPGDDFPDNPLLPDLPGFMKSIPRPFSSREMALEESARAYSLLSNTELAMHAAQQEYLPFGMTG